MPDAPCRAWAEYWRYGRGRHRRAIARVIMVQQTPSETYYTLRYANREFAIVGNDRVVYNEFLSGQLKLQYAEEGFDPDEHHGWENEPQNWLNLFEYSNAARYKQW